MKDGMTGNRILAFQIALQRTLAAGSDISGWKRLIDHFIQHIPLLVNGIESSELDGTLVGGSVTERGGEQYFLGAALIIRGNINSLRPCTVIASKAATYSCRVVISGAEEEYNGRWVLFPFDEQKMEWIPTVLGYIPARRGLVKGGYKLDTEGSMVDLYFARSEMGGSFVYGSTSISQASSYAASEDRQCTVCCASHKGN